MASNRQVEISKITGKPKRKYSRKNKAGLPAKFMVKPEDNPLVPLLAQQVAKGKEITLDQADRLSLYIHLYLTPKEDGSRRTKKEAALEAGYSLDIANNTACIENLNGFQRRMADYVNAWPRGDLRCECVSVAQDILVTAEKPSDKLAAARYITEIVGEYAPKRVETASISLKGKLPDRK